MNSPASDSRNGSRRKSARRSARRNCWPYSPRQAWRSPHSPCGRIGPAAGVYVTDSKAAVEAAVTRYETATDGALLYAEDAGCNAAGAIELGEYGLFSNGLARAPSGTLVVVGPVEMAQEAWENNRDRMSAAAHLTLEAGLRVVVLCATPMPQNVRDDVVLLLREAGWDDHELAASLRGIVAEDGALVATVPVRPVAAFPHPRRSRRPSCCRRTLPTCCGRASPFGRSASSSSGRGDSSCPAPS